MASEGESGSLRDEAGKVSDSRTGRGTARKSRRGGAAGTSRFGEVHFVNISHPSDVGSQMTDIRRFVMRGGNQQRRTQESRPENPPNIRPGSDNSSPGRSLPPLGSFPVPGDTRMLELVRFANEVTDVYIPFRATWFEVSLMDPGAFEVILGNNANLWERLRTNNIVAKTPEAMRHYSQSIVQLRQRLDDEAAVKGQGIIANVLGHVCLNMRHCDWTSWKVHMDGLCLILNTRGGLCDLSYQILLLILLYDLVGGLVFDTRPRLPLYASLGIPSPNGDILSTPPRLRALLLRLVQKSDLVEAGEAMMKMSHMSGIIKEKSRSSTFWKKDIDGLLMISPALHFLLSMPRLPDDYMTHTNRTDLVARELVRLTCLTVMSVLKERLSFFTVERAGLQARLVQFIAANIRYVEPDFFDLKVWVLITGALMEERSLRDLYINEIKHTMMITNTSVGNLVHITQEMVWIDALMSSSANELIQDIAQGNS
ncbi:hypothetical protein T069G_04991 [Trichoderma breve]|uniref:Uncharacterized protein n=1 Tax=Trichoderma breve TaxID=2034170 RepID=A0A9W9BB34_9HYPO|nr:hypothetical protein T069G_04991 [Trichoderma breve]KAJ4860003.1 hypothetical protein T069G_04991 [Trichoderma breve]